MTFRQFREAVKLLQGSKKPLIVVLKEVDADALGSSLALAEALTEQDADVNIFCETEIPATLKFLVPHSLSIFKNIAEINLAERDLVVVADAGQLKRTGVADKINAMKARGVPLLNIDHHGISESFGTVNLVDPNASAAAVLLYDVLKLGGWTLNKKIATQLLAGIITDTGNFSNAGTTIRALEVAAHCYALGAQSRKIIKELYQSKPVDSLKLWGKILSRLTKNNRWGIVATVILQEDYREYDLDDESTEGLANFLNNIQDMRAALILKELPNGEIRGSLRTTRDDVDVGKLAKVLGGGGHKKAAGFSLQGHIVRRDGRWSIE